MRRPGRVGWAWIDASSLAVLLGAGGYLLEGPLGSGVGVAAGGLVPLLIERARRQENAAELARGAETAQRRYGPASLLDPGLGVVPVTGRHCELTALRDWCLDPSAGLVRLISGGGGVGKTRLALELRRRMAAEGWRCVQVDAGSESDVVALERQAAPRARLLLTVDYAEARTGLEELFNAVARDAGSVRVLLLARQAGEWWQRLEAGQQAVRDLVAEAGRAHLPLADAVEPGVPAVEVVRRVMPLFASWLGVPPPDPGRVRIASQDGARVLDLHAAALVAVLASHHRHAGGAVLLDVGMVLEELLGHEKHYWLGRAEALGLLGGPGGLSLGQLSQLVAAGCLLGAQTRAEAAELAGRVPGVAPSYAVAMWLRELYPPGADGQWLGSLRPDRLAELHATRELAASAELAQSCLTGLDERQARQALILLARASAEHHAARLLLGPALFRFSEVISRIDAPREAMIAIANAIPYPSVTLAEADASITSRIVATYAPGTAARASWQGTCSTLLAYLGRREDALAAIDEVVTTYRDLARAQRGAFDPDLAMSLHNQSVYLARLGRREEALASIEEAVTIRRGLARARPGALGPDLAKSLHDQSLRQAELGRLEDALASSEEAVTTYRALAVARPAAFAADLAASLDNLAIALKALGRHAEAETARREAEAIQDKS